MRWGWIMLAMIVVGAGGFAVYSATRGLRNNNPGNLRYDPRITWRGQVGQDDKGFVLFAAPADGIRALAINLRNQQTLHGLDTVAAIIAKYAPSNENDTAGYIADVSNRMGVTPAQHVSLRNDATLAALVAAVIHHENGIQPYDVALIDAGVSAA